MMQGCVLVLQDFAGIVLVGRNSLRMTYSKGLRGTK